MLKHSRYIEVGCFTLPTVLVASVVMLIALSSVGVYLSTSVAALNGKIVRDIAVSYNTTCALTEGSNTSERLYCWGGNRYATGGLGHDDGCQNNSTYRYLCSPTPVVMETPGLKNKQIDSITAGVNRMCALAEGVSYCSGLNTNAQIGDGTTTHRYKPTEAKLFRQYRPSLMY